MSSFQLSTSRPLALGLLVWLGVASLSFLTAILAKDSFPRIVLILLLFVVPGVAAGLAGTAAYSCARNRATAAGTAARKGALFAVGVGAVAAFVEVVVVDLIILREPGGHGWDQIGLLAVVVLVLLAANTVVLGITGYLLSWLISRSARSGP